MQLSDWQLARLRNAVRIYRYFECAVEGTKFGWNGVSEAIAEVTGLEIPKERIRQFCEGVPRKDGSTKFSTPENDRVEALYNFVVDPDVALLTEEDFKERNIDMMLAQRLVEYLDRDIDFERIPPPKSMEGHYYTIREDLTAAGQQNHITSQLVIGKPLTSGVVRVFETDRYWEDGQNPQLFAKYPDKTGLPPQFNSEDTYTGWGILSPEETFFIFLKNTITAENRFYFSMMSDMVYFDGMPMTALALYHHTASLNIHDDMLKPEGLDGQAFDAFASGYRMYSRGNKTKDDDLEILEVAS